MEKMMNKVIKLIRIFYDGSVEYLDGDDLEKYLSIQDITESHASIHGINIEWKRRKQKWKKPLKSKD